MFHPQKPAKLKETIASLEGPGIGDLVHAPNHSMGLGNMYAYIDF